MDEYLIRSREFDDEAHLEHIGIKRRSGRYPWGSGGDENQRSKDFKAYYDAMKAKKLTDGQIAEGIEGYINGDRKEGERYVTFKTTDLRAAIAISTEAIRAENVSRAQGLAAKQYSNGAIAEIMGLPRSAESTVRGWLKDSDTIKENSLRATADTLKRELESKPYLDVGKGTQLWMGISETKLRTALAMLRDEGFQVHPIDMPQLGTEHQTKYRVLTKGDVTWSEARQALIRGELKNIQDHSEDGGLTYVRPDKTPVSVDLKRVEVNYADTGGHMKDGVIELRRDVADLSLGDSRYAQVRVAVGGTHYLKGMAMYADDLPAGVDVRFNTNKTKAEAPTKLDAMKPLNKLDKDDPDSGLDPSNPFGASTKPTTYTDKSGKTKTSPLNIVNEEGTWETWSRSLSSQMLSKQPIVLASKQLGEARASREKELGEILRLNNPVVKQKLLEEFADSADAAAVHLKAAAMDRQITHVILPFNKVRPTEVYAPNYENGEKVVLVRHPHGGPFEIPALTVNNKNPEAKRIIGGARDAIGIHHSVAQQLSGADFDGDTVLVIPNPKGSVKTQKPLKDLEGFDPKVEYSIPKDDTTTKRMTKKNTQTEMGKISNLITDMTIRGANQSEIARAVKHSMVVIDAEKHGLNYKASERDNGISALKATYQAPAKGASTLISRSSATARVPQQKPRAAQDGGPVNKKTGELEFTPTGATYPKTTEKVNKKTGEVTTKTTIEPKTTKGSQMEFTKDAFDLSSGQPIERVYALHANAMKALANEARKNGVAIRAPRQSPAAKKLYADEIKSLDAKLKVALRNAPLERRAQVVGNAMAKARIDANPGLDKDDIKKIKGQALEDARLYTQANKVKIGSADSPITSREWEAIQSGAIAATKLREILANGDMKTIRQLATPRPTTSLTPGQLARIKALSSLGRSPTEIAASLGIPRTTVSDNMKKR